MSLKGLAYIHSEDLAHGQTGMARPSHNHVINKVFDNFNEIRPTREVLHMPQKRALKNLLCGLVVAGILAQPLVPKIAGLAPGPFGSTAYAAETTANSNSRQAQGNQTSKVALLLVLAVKEENPVKALELLQAAREELKRENINSENANRALAAIDAIEAKIRRKLPPAPAPATTAVAPATGTPAPSASHLTGDLPTVVGLNQTSTTNTSVSGVSVPPMAEKEIQALIAQNPEVREALWEIGQGRLSRDAANLDGIIKEKTGKSLDEIDAEEALAIAFGNQPGPFYQLLERLNLMNLDVAKSNLKLKQEFDGVSIDVLADKIIMDATKYSIPAGVLQGVLADSGMGGRFLGISSEVLMTFVINANLALRLSDLYGIEMNNSEKEIILLVVFSIAKVAGQYGTKAAGAGGGMPAILAKFGEKLGHLKAGGKPGEFVSYLQRILKAPAMAKVAGSAATEIMAIQTAPSGGAESDASKKDTAKESPTETDPKKIAKAKSESLIRNVAAKVNLVSLLKAGLHGTRSAAETYGLGQAAKYIFKAAHESKRAIHNDNFRRFLMTPAGEGFLKLMVLSMNDGRIDLIATNSQQASDQKRKAAFITNIARSGKACSAEDSAALAAAAKSSASSPAISSYTCKANPNTSRFDRLKKEMLTFDEIPSEYISDLRIVSREHRFRMAELIIQMQFLDGDRSPSEVQYFRSTVAKALGVSEVQDLEYFDRIHAFVVDRGGLEPSVKHPAGFKIRGTADPAPYDMGQGYTPPDSPQHSSQYQGQSDGQGQKRDGN